MVTNRQHLPTRKSRIAGFLAAVVLCLFSLGLNAQQYLAGISGTVTDGTGAVVVGATVTAENVDTHFKTSATTNQAGAYSIPFLTPGPYSVLAAADGFRSAQKTGFQLHAADKVIADMQLAVGTAKESIQVTADLQMLDTGSASLGQVLDKQEIVELPNMGRNPFVEATLSAGPDSANMVSGSASQYNPPYSGTASQMQIGGLGNYHRLELNGMPDDAPERLSAVTYTDFVPSPEAVQEVNTQTLLVDAQFGHSDGAVINTIVKTGQNDYHGAAYYILRNTDMDANTTQRKISSVQSTKGQPSVDRWQQPGFVVDGPIRIPKFYNGRDKSFFTVAYERIQNNLPNPYTGFMPTDAMRSGDFSSLCSSFNTSGFCTSGIQLYNPNSAIDSTGNRTSYFANNNIAGYIDPVAAAIIKYFPEPNSSNPTSSVNYISGDDTIKDHYWSFITRLDYKITPQQTLTGLFFRSVRTQDYPVQGFGIGGNGVGGPGYTHYRKDTGASADWTYQLSSSLVLDSRLGFVYHPFSLTYHGDNFNLTGLGFSSTFASEVPRQTFPGISFSNGTNSYSSATGGGGSYSEATASSWTEVLTKAIGRHSIKAGFEGNDLRYNLASTSASASNIGTFNFTRGFTQKNYSSGDSTSGDPMASFLLGAINSDTVNWYGPMAYDQKYVGFFVHDDWRYNNKLTMNIGLRWDYEAPMTERHNQMNAGFCATCTNPLQASVSGLTLNGGLQFVNSSKRTGYNKQLNNWQPRFGAAYQMNSKTVFRGGLGLIYMPTFDQPGATGFSQSTGYTSTTSASPNTPAHSFANPYPDGLVSPTGSSLGLATALGQGLSPEDVNHRQPRLFFGAVGGEYQLPRGAVVEVDYVGNFTRHMPVSKAINALPASDFALGATELNTLVTNPMAGLISTNSTLNAATIVKSALLIPYPEFGGITMYNRPLGFTSYNAMQASIRKRFSDGMSFQFHYTWSKQMNATGYLNSTDNWDQLFRREADVPNRLWNVIGSYDIPTPFRTNYFSRMWLGGWSLHAVVRGHNGSLISYPGASGAQVDRIAGVSLRGGGNNRSMKHQFNTCYIDANGATQPGGYDKTLTSGSCGYGDGTPAWKLRTATTTATTGYALTTATYSTVMPGIRQMVLPIADASLFKKFVIHEKVNFELRGSFYNIANTPNYGKPNSTLTTTGTSGAGTVTWSQGNDARMGEVTARINF